jgi:Fe-Mn family superoxide dismutase
MQSERHPEPTMSDIRRRLLDADAAHATRTTLRHALPPLPYAESAFEPVLSAKTLAVHHGKHHRAYVDALNRLIPGTPFALMTLEDIVLATSNKPQHAAVFNNAAQAWNHAFYWRSIDPLAGEATSPALRALIHVSFGNMTTLKEQLASAAVQHFGSGWVWLVVAGRRLMVITSHDAQTPLERGLRPLLGLDVWEHAYYLDYQNRRDEYVHGMVDRFLNWDFAAANLRAD